MVLGGALGRMWGELLHDRYGRSFPTHQAALIPASTKREPNSWILQEEEDEGEGEEGEAKAERWWWLMMTSSTCLQWQSFSSWRGIRFIAMAIYDVIVTNNDVIAYAQAGASAFVAAVTHAPSASILMFEISGQIRYLLPSLVRYLAFGWVLTHDGVIFQVSTLVAYSISRNYSLSIFNIVSKRRNYLVLPEPVRV